jgi:hypothetical protein
MMASNTRLWSNGFNLSVPPPVFNPEEYLILSQNKLAFPNFNFIPALHNPRGKSLATVNSCTMGGMSETIGKYRDMPGMGFELFWNGKRVNGPEAGLRLEYADLSPRPRHVHLQCRTVYGPARRSSTAKSTPSAEPIR